jgi:myo-inositol 2-dehydrogenase/D-chiro-inositol 1-dehydrogenase
VNVSGGIFLDMTIHDFDMAQFLIGDEVEDIYPAAGVMVNPRPNPDHFADAETLAS